MAHDIERADLVLMLEAVQRSVFTRFTLRMNGTHVSASRLRAAEAVDETEVTEVIAPRVGRFHPDVAAGTEVDADTAIGSIESFRKIVPVRAGRAGKIVSLRVPGGSFVEYGQPLARLRIASAAGDP